MTSTCIFKDTLRNDTQVFFRFKDSTLRILYISSFQLHSWLPKFIDAEQELGKYQRKCHLMKSELSLPAIPVFFRFQFHWISCCDKKIFIHFLILKIQDGLHYLIGFNGLRCILRGATVERTKPTTTLKVCLWKLITYNFIQLHTAHHNSSIVY